MPFFFLNSRSSDRLNTWWVSQDLRKCSAECRVVWMSGSQENCKQQYRRSSSQHYQIIKHDLKGKQMLVVQ